MHCDLMQFLSGVLRVLLLFDSVQANPHGDVSRQFVVCGNAAVAFLGRTLLPLLRWLELDWFVENPAARKHSC